MKEKTKTVLNLMFMILFLYASGLDAGEISVDKSPDEAFISSRNSFALAFYKELAKKEGNIFFSPVSIYSAMAMTYAGARGETAAQIKNALRISQTDEQLHNSFKEFMSGLNEKDPDYELKIANSIWPHIDYKFRDDFLNLLKEKYFAWTQALDYKNPQEACAIVNGWIEEKTNGKIKDMLSAPPVTPFTRLILVNAIYFKGSWEEKFDEKKTKEEEFFVSKDNSVKCMMMNAKLKKARFFEDDAIQVLQQPYKGGLSMLIILPKEKCELKKIEEKLDYAKFAEIRKSLYRADVIAAIPRFKTTVSAGLNDYFRNLGVQDAFEAGKADFSGMDGTKELFIQAILHKAFVDVNEEGTEAAAATSMIVGITSMPPPPMIFRADHPFLFFICGKNGEILFIGRVSDPNQGENKL